MTPSRHVQTGFLLHRPVHRIPCHHDTVIWIVVISHTDCHNHSFVVISDIIILIINIITVTIIVVINIVVFETCCQCPKV